MRERRKYILIFLFSILSMLTLFNCSKPMSLSGAPSDEDAIKAIKNWIQRSPMTVQSPIQILERGSRKENGSWSFKVKFTASTLINSTVLKKFEKETTFDISKSQEKSGKDVWIAEEVK